MIPGTPARLQADACLRGMLGGLDPRSAYLSVEELKLLSGASGQGAIGLEMRKSGDSAEIVSVIDGTPSAKAGIVAGTGIVSIDSKPTAAMSLPEVAAALRGSVGSIV